MHAHQNNCGSQLVCEHVDFFSLSAKKKNQKRNYLSLDKKIKVIKYTQKNPGVGVRALGEIFDWENSKE